MTSVVRLQDADRIITDVLARADRVPRGPEAVVWRRLAAQLDGRPAGFRSAVVANLLALATLDDPADLLVYHELAKAAGHAEVARRQQEALDLAGDGQGLPMTTAVVRRLGGAFRVESALVDAVGISTTADVVSTCGAGVVHLLLAGLPAEPLPDVRPIASVEEMHDLHEHGNAAVWRAHVAAIAAHPWGPYPKHLRELADRAGKPHFGAGAALVAELCRADAEQAERRAVAREIRKLVAESGLSQRAFASAVGTSASRLSTYVTGSVVPSAAMMLRITRTGRRFAEARAVSAG
ncbi:helix-turn-helix transcriptional regulator [Nocardioides sp. TF02-7]|uniref:helix-turn-helix domain-containing protein n=1 Tax=Nocardioides sp. TF02-7 TaxID=2917724 RepID=UPI001F06EF1D|nr:helix-turn-helix transcriptional regulator [Nocardioides sp. TF02-7]UMG93633.1 helix-turn-helix domain-containing protein [Nocardioides sp. TF02-7]